MKTFADIFTNTALWAACTAWFINQIVKFLLHIVVYKKVVFERLVGDGGMPSAHTATVTSLATSIGMIYGFDSGYFAIAAMLAIITMHDAMGVRRETGKQSQVLNQMIDIFKTTDGTPFVWTDKKLKEFVGHSLPQVVAGFILGLIVGILYTYPTLI